MFKIETYFKTQDVEEVRMQEKVADLEAKIELMGRGDNQQVLKIKSQKS